MRKTEKGFIFATFLIVSLMPHFEKYTMLHNKAEWICCSNQFYSTGCLITVACGVHESPQRIISLQLSWHPPNYLRMFLLLPVYRLLYPGSVVCHTGVDSVLKCRHYFMIPFRMLMLHLWFTILPTLPCLPHPSPKLVTPWTVHLLHDNILL